jgi:hypothetical protein
MKTSLVPGVDSVSDDFLQLSEMKIMAKRKPNAIIDLLFKSINFFVTDGAVLYSLHNKSKIDYI